MRPHTFVLIAVMLHYLQNPTSSKTYFTVKMSIYKGSSNRTSERTYRINVDDKGENRWKMRVSREEGQIRYYCEVIIQRPKVNEDKFIIEHDHRKWITEEFAVYSGSLEGQYNGHAAYTRFRTSQRPDPSNLYIYTDLMDLRYQVDSFS